MSATVPQPPLLEPTPADGGAAPEQPARGLKVLLNRFMAGLRGESRRPGKKVFKRERPLTPTIGATGEPLRILAFSGGGLDTLMQLGVTHALLVGKSQAPDVVSGVSAGAINAVGLAEILQAGRPTLDRAPDETRDEAEAARHLQSERVAQVGKFREVFEGCLEVPGELLESAMPDPYEVNARAPLKAQKLPIHNREERIERDSAVRARFGLVRFLNEVLSIRIHISTLTVVVRRVLELIRLKEAEPDRFERLWQQACEVAGLWWVLSTRLVVLSPLVFHGLLGVCLGGSYRTLSSLEERKARAEKLTRGEEFRRWRLAAMLSFFGSWQANSAKQIITQSKLKQLVLGVVEYTIGSALSLWLLTAPTMLVLHALIWVWFHTVTRRTLQQTFDNHTSDIIWTLSVMLVLAALGWLATSRTQSAETGKAESRLQRAVTWVGEYAFGLVMFIWLFLVVALMVFEVVLGCTAFLHDWLPSLLDLHDWLLRHVGVECWGLTASLMMAGMLAATAKWWLPRGIERLFASLDLESDLLTPFVLKPIFVRLFDRDYYGKLEFSELIDTALKTNEEAGPPTNAASGGKRLWHYVNQPGMPIYVAPAVANIARVHGLGQIEVAGLNEKVVDALLAACAATPLFRAQQLRETALDAPPGEPQFYIDAINVANDSSFVILRQLRRMYSARLARAKPGLEFDEHTLREDIALADGIKGIEIYPVSPFPVSRGTLEKTAPATTDRAADKTYSTLVAATLRAQQLKRFQDATLERKFIQRYARALPPDTTFYEYEVTQPDGSKIRRVSASAQIHPIETDHALNLNVRVLGSTDKDARRNLVAEAVADGCRAALEVMMAASIQHAAREASSPAAIPCRTVVLRRVGQHNLLPGSADVGGPGLPEVCRHCCLNRRSKDPARPELPQHLEVRPLEAGAKVKDWPVWVDEYTGETRAVQPFVSTRKPDKPAAQNSAAVNVEWPRQRNEEGMPAEPARSDKKRPTVSFLFSGGVFRGVFQVGVINALSESGVRPDLMAGASIGTITSAMVGTVFNQPSEARRRAQVARLAAIFLSIDRLVLTDRFADFIRRFTLRAAEADFSLRDADMLFRRFDQGGFARFNRHARRVAAGLERLFHLNPFELTALTKAVRNGNTAQAWRRLSAQVEDFLERNGVGQEVLGAEPLALLIREVVLAGGCSTTPDAAEFDFFLKDAGLHLLATTTNLTQGRLEILSSLPDNPKERVLLKEGLLASSAFPAVFRPRWSWEVYPQASTTDKLVDGGVMDNLPVDAVVSFLWRAWKRGLIELSPPTAPHLLFTASLQVRQRELSGRALVDTATNWSKLKNRARRLRYNQKIDRFAEVQRNFRAIREKRLQDGSLAPSDWRLLDLETLVVKPEWLVGTFAFNSMLGFRRKLQAASIAHGCAITFAELQGRQIQHPGWSASWGIRADLGFLDARPPAAAGGVEGMRAGCLIPRERSKARQNEGTCWFRDVPCPFSRAHLLQAPPDTRPPADTIEQLDQIHRLCGDPRTHQPGAAKAL